jgi:hypothetical protein
MSELAALFLVLGLLVLVLVASSRRQPVCVVAVQPVQWEPPPEEDWPVQIPFA